MYTHFWGGHCSLTKISQAVTLRTHSCFTSSMAFGIIVINHDEFVRVPDKIDGNTLKLTKYNAMTNECTEFLIEDMNYTYIWAADCQTNSKLLYIVLNDNSLAFGPTFEMRTVWRATLFCVNLGDGSHSVVADNVRRLNRGGMLMVDDEIHIFKNDVCGDGTNPPDRVTAIHYVMDKSTGHYMKESTMDDIDMQMWHSKHLWSRNSILVYGTSTHPRYHMCFAEYSLSSKQWTKWTWPVAECLPNR